MQKNMVLLVTCLLALSYAIAFMEYGLIIFFILSFLFLGIPLIVRHPKNAMLALAIFLLFSGYFVSQFGKYSLVGMMISRSEEIVVLICTVVCLSGRQFRDIIKTNFFIKVFILLLVCVAVTSSIVNHLIPYRLAVLDLFLLLKGFAVFYIFSSLTFSIEEIKAFSKRVFVLSLVILLLGIFDFINPPLLRALIHTNSDISYRFGFPSAQSIFIIPSMFGWFMIFIACFCFAAYFVKQNTKYLLGAIFFILASLLSMKLRPLLGLSGVFFISLLILPLRSKVRMIIVGSGLIGLFMILYGGIARMLIEDRVYSYLTRPDINNVARSVLYKTSFIIAQDFFPLGSGLGTFGGWISALYYSPLYTQYGISGVYGLERGGKFIMDTFWPYLLGQFGFLGVLFYLMIISLLFINTVRIFNGANDLFIKSIALGAVFVLSESFFESIAVGLFLRPPEYFYIFMSLGIAHSLFKSERSASLMSNNE